MNRPQHRKQTADEDPQKKKDTDLLISCSMGLTNRVRELVAEGANLFATHSDGQTALHYAAAYGHEDLLEYCLDQGMGTDRPNAIGRTPLFNAVENRRPEMIHLLIKAGANPNYRDKAGKTPLHIAAQFDRSDSARALLTHTATNPFLRDDAGETAMDVARKKNSPSVLSCLMQAISLIHARRIKRGYRNRRRPTP